ncbi:hypothetical protein Ddc_00522 [Ditylenchus destructor]|nr:hypothetical protein Ddc_00522 [Ditylenchus destructor]
MDSRLPHSSTAFLDLNSLLPRCSKCRSLFTVYEHSPCIIACTHTFCCKCISELNRSKKNRRCPICFVKFSTYQINLSYLDLIVQLRIMASEMSNCNECLRLVPKDKLRRCVSCEDEVYRRTDFSRAKNNRAIVSCVICLECALETHRSHVLHKEGRNVNHTIATLPSAASFQQTHQDTSREGRTHSKSHAREAKVPRDFISFAKRLINLLPNWCKKISPFSSQNIDEKNRSRRSLTADKSTLKNPEKAEESYPNCSPESSWGIQTNTGSPESNSTEHSSPKSAPPFSRSFSLKSGIQTEIMRQNRTRVRVQPMVIQPHMVKLPETKSPQIQRTITSNSDSEMRTPLRVPMKHSLMYANNASKYSVEHTPMRSYVNSSVNESQGKIQHVTYADVDSCL